MKYENNSRKQNEAQISHAINRAWKYIRQHVAQKHHYDVDIHHCDVAEAPLHDFIGKKGLQPNADYHQHRKVYVKYGSIVFRKIKVTVGADICHQNNGGCDNIYRFALVFRRRHGGKQKHQHHIGGDRPQKIGKERCHTQSPFSIR
ncbi:hypothetical protein SDC9_36710 [bioreactor metagenome]|uniref:Uncharacterized protein n=1 Tax=bioreactor metagenome TaxID=1076179 RepID=A0A644VH60_9ZZZZ